MSGLPVGAIAGIPVFASPWFALLLVWSVSRAPSIAEGVLWCLALVVSLLIHELGHAVVARRFRLNPRILLHGWGGLCAHDRAERDAHDALIIAAGPGAGFLFGGAVLAFEAAATRFAPELVASPAVGPLLGFLAFINLGWGLVNLLPLWPLDGGQLFRLALARFVRPRTAERVTAAVGLTVCAAALFVAASLGGLTLLIVLMLAWQNLEIFRGARSAGPFRAQNRAVQELVDRARGAFAAEQYAEAARLCHQLRAEPRVPERALAESWRIVGLSTWRLGRTKEALGYLKRATLDAEVGEAWLACLIAEDRLEEAHALVASKEWARLGARGVAIEARAGRDAPR